MAPWCGLVSSANDVLLELTGLSKAHSWKRLADVALGFADDHFSFLGIDFMIASSSRAAADPKQQQSENSSNLRKEEILKWRGTIRTKPNKTNADGMPHVRVWGCDIIADLLQQDVVLFPAALDPHIAKGAAFSRLVDKCRMPYFFSRLNFRTTAARADVGYRISIAARQSHATSLFQEADLNWRMKHGSKLFGSTYIDTCPSAWASVYLDATLTRAFANHVLHAL